MLLDAPYWRWQQSVQSLLLVAVESDTEKAKHFRNAIADAAPAKRITAKVTRMIMLGERIVVLVSTMVDMISTTSIWIMPRNSSKPVANQPILACVSYLGQLFLVRP